MGNCLRSSEYQTYARGENPDLLTLQYRNTLAQQQENEPVKKTHTVLNKHASKYSLQSHASRLSMSSVQTNQWNIMTSEEKDLYMLEEMKKEVEALMRRKVFLENIRDALQQINDEVQSIDDEDENDLYQDNFRKQINSTLLKSQVVSNSKHAGRRERKSLTRRMEEKRRDRQLKKVNNFHFKQFKRKSIQRVPVLEGEDEEELLTQASVLQSLNKATHKTLKDLQKSEKDSNLIASTGSTRSKPRASKVFRPIVKELDGEGTREWNNDFGARLMLVRSFYSWTDIPL